MDVGSSGGVERGGAGRGDEGGDGGRGGGGRGWGDGRAGREEKEGVKESFELRQVDWKTTFRFSINCIEWNLSKSAFLLSRCVF